MRLSDITRHIEGELVRDGEFSVIAFATEYEQKNFLTFLEKEKFLPALSNENISCVLCTPELADKMPAHIKGVFVCRRPKASLFALHNALSEHEAYVGKSFPTKIGKNCCISPLASIPAENVIIGDNVTIEPMAVLKGRVVVGDNVVIRSGAVIGCKGFSFSKDEEGNNISVIDTAQIILKTGVEIFENVTISIGIFPWEKTVIGENTKIDAQCHVGHGTHTGKNCLLAAGCRCCGNTLLGDNVWIGVGAIVSNRVSVGSGARVSIGAVATKNVPDGVTVSGNFAIEHHRFLENLKKSIQE